MKYFYKSNGILTVTPWERAHSAIGNLPSNLAAAKRCYPYHAKGHEDWLAHQESCGGCFTIAHRSDATGGKWKRVSAKADIPTDIINFM